MNTKFPMRRTVTARDARKSGKLAERALVFYNGKIALSFARRLERTHGTWIWDGILYERDSITNPWLQILPNTAGRRISQLMQQVYDAQGNERCLCLPDKNRCMCQLFAPSPNHGEFCANCGCPCSAHPRLKAATPPLACQATPDKEAL